MSTALLRKSLTILLASIFLSACGGGGGGESNSSGSQPPTDSQAPDKNEPDTTNKPLGPANKSATLTWEAPTTNTDGSCLTNLQSFNINYGLSSGVYGHTDTLDSQAAACSSTGQQTTCGEVLNCSYMVENLSSASWYFAIQAVDSVGNISEPSEEGIKTIQ
ncbi:hypothetical protein [Aliidiomarina quisquiliarum]|uniref:hypothetical protein n=1 Tax=Aliidiomarina quisquiliarum TaxID=2938947 RepID=UPI00208F3FC2|nr:hypothetical protein [Aliidiomarina quisquiliarum]MCO4321595.1 hypothetical protein [Aliidiomarina quisquiliarum]